MSLVPEPHVAQDERQDNQQPSPAFVAAGRPGSRLLGLTITGLDAKTLLVQPPAVVQVGQPSPKDEHERTTATIGKGHHGDPHCHESAAISLSPRIAGQPCASAHEEGSSAGSLVSPARRASPPNHGHQKRHAVRLQPSDDFRAIEPAIQQQATHFDAGFLELRPERGQHVGHTIAGHGHRCQGEPLAPMGKRRRGCGPKQFRPLLGFDSYQRVQHGLVRHHGEIPRADVFQRL